MTARLASAQREIARLLRAPGGVREALAEAGDAEGAGLARLVRGDARVGAATRLEIYASAIFARIHDALARELEALARCVGPEGFHDLVALYAMVHPSRHPSLRRVGDALPDFLALHPAAEPLRRRWPWASDLARLEWALSLAFDAKGAPVLTREHLAEVAPEAWGELVLRLHPSAQLLRLDWPVHRCLGPHGEGPPAAPEPTSILVWRRDERPHHAALEPLEAELLEAAREGEPFGALCARAARHVGEAEAPPRAAALLAGWVEAELLAAPPSGPTGGAASDRGAP